MRKCIRCGEEMEEDFKVTGERADRFYCPYSVWAEELYADFIRGNKEQLNTSIWFG